MTKFNDRYFMMKDILNRYYETNQLPEKNNNSDPFWDPPEPLLIGQAFLCLEGLPYYIDNVTELTLVGDEGDCGKLKVGIIPTDESGQALGENAELIDDPSTIVGKRLDFILEIGEVVIKSDLYKDTYCEYLLLLDDGSPAPFTTTKVEGPGSS
jgi:hypothetical protein